MKAAAFLFCLVAMCTAFPSDMVRVFEIDEFAESSSLVIILPDGAPPVAHRSVAQTEGQILGGERDVEVTVFDTRTNSVFSVSNVEGSLHFSSPPSSRSELLIQYDGLDNIIDEGDSSLVLNPSGLGGADLTDGGLATALYIEVTTDLDTTLHFTLYSDATTTSEFSLPVEASADARELQVPFSSFVGDASFTNVGALEVRLLADTSVDATYSELATIGPVDTPVDPDGRVYMLNPMACAPEWPAVVPIFETSSYSTSFTTTTSASTNDDDDDDDCNECTDDDDDSSRDDDDSSRSSDDDDSSNNSSDNSSNSDDDDDSTARSSRTREHLFTTFDVTNAEALFSSSALDSLQDQLTTTTSTGSVLTASWVAAVCLLAML